jgi:hypothetical protein
MQNNEMTVELHTIGMPQKGDKVYLKDPTLVRGNNWSKFGILVTITGVRYLTSMDYRVRYTYANERDGTVERDSFDVCKVRLKSGRVKWSNYLVKQDEATLEEVAEFAQAVANRAEKRARDAREWAEMLEAEKNFQVNNKHLVEREPVVHPIEVVAYELGRFENPRLDKHLKVNVMRTVQMRVESWKYTGCGKHMRVASRFETITANVFRNKVGNWQVNHWPSASNDGEKNRRAIEVMQYAMNWCAEQNKSERARIESFRQMRREAVAA